jgi:ABC transport system ATP-binding/permease protein
VPVISAQDLHKAFGVQTILDGVTLTIRSGERVGLLGVNGSGKSTLARILAGREIADSGTVSKRKGAEVLYLDQNPTFEPGHTAREAVLSGMKAWSEARARHEALSVKLATSTGDDGDATDRLLTEQTEAAADVERLGGWDREHQVDAMLGHLGVERPDGLVAEFSGGEQRRVALARILIARPHLAVLDEPTNHLDVETVDWLEQYLIEEHEGALLLITHDRYLLDRVAERTFEIDRGKLYTYDGGYEDYLEAKAERQAMAARTESNRQNFLRTELEWLRRQPKARSTKQKARIERAEAAKAAPPPRAERTALITVDETRSGKTVLELRKVTLEVGGKTLIEALDLILTPGERVGVVGRNGSGKTTLLRAVTGDLLPTRGQVVVGQNSRVAYFDQARSGLDDSKSIFDNVVGDQPKIEIGGEVIEPRAYLERFLFDPHKQRQPVASLSGGERARVALARLLRQRSNLLLLDEPTNDLDVATLGALEAMLVEFAGTALVVTHDRWFLDRVATAILAFEGDGRVVLYQGNYDQYRRLKAEAEARKQASKQAGKQAAPEASARAAAPKAARKPSVKLSYSEEHELADLPDRIDEAEQAVVALETRLNDPTLYAEGSKDQAKSLLQELENAREEAAGLMARWEELEARRAAQEADRKGAG